MVPAARNANLVALHAIDQAVLVGDSTRPVALKAVLERLGLADPLIAVASEAAVTLLGATPHILFHYVVITASKGSRDEEARARMVHDGRYKRIALTTAVVLAGDQRLAEIALGIDSGDWDENAGA